MVGGACIEHSAGVSLETNCRRASWQRSGAASVQTIRIRTIIGKRPPIAAKASHAFVPKMRVSRPESKRFGEAYGASIDPGVLASGGEFRYDFA